MSQHLGHNWSSVSMSAPSQPLVICCTQSSIARSQEHPFSFSAIRRGRRRPRSSFYYYFKNSSRNLQFDPSRLYAYSMDERVGKHRSFSKKCKGWLKQGVLLLRGCQPPLPATHEVEWMLVPEAGCHTVSEHTATSL